ncbi:MAG TPA: nitronate monooxygenase [Gemmatimonadaceae bacterium]|nr:nitronate monooxygenase [Gemmatimonadaceae bacterium]
MLHTPLCDLFDIDLPIVQAAMGPITSPELVAAVSNAGALGSIGAVERSADELRREIARVRDLTDRPFAVNFLVSRIDEDGFETALEAHPAVISLALGDPGNRVKRAHDAGARVMHQVHTVRQALEAAERGVDAIIAQGTEAGGNCGDVSTVTLVPQVVDAVAPIPVLAAGGIADGRGFAAALVLGAQGINIGTRFLASLEARCGEGWKRAVVDAESEDAVKVQFWNDLFPRHVAGSYDAIPRALRTAFITRWEASPLETGDTGRLRDEILAGIRAGRMHEYVPLAGQSAGMIREVLPAAEIVHRLAAEAAALLRRVAAYPEQRAPARVASRDVEQPAV